MLIGNSIMCSTCCYYLFLVGTTFLYGWTEPWSWCTVMLLLLFMTYV